MLDDPIRRRNKNPNFLSSAMRTYSHIGTKFGGADRIPFIIYQLLLLLSFISDILSSRGMRLNAFSQNTTF